MDGAICALAATLALVAGAQVPSARTGSATLDHGVTPPRVLAARRFLAERGPAADRRRNFGLVGGRGSGPVRVRPLNAATAAWQPIGPLAVESPSLGLVTGRVSALALDPSDSTGNLLYLGATGGGVWVSHNAGISNTGNVAFAPLTDDLAAFTGDAQVSISIGALTVQPGGTGVILAGTGDPNDALDSYYGAGILRSADGGKTWTQISESLPVSGVQSSFYSFAGEGFAGFAWGTANPQLAVAAVSQAYEAILVDATTPQVSYEGLYYSADGGQTWLLATITDGAGADVQGPNDQFAQPDGNAATSVVWNPIRQLFMAAVRFHGYYQSPDGITWTRMAVQPGVGLSTTLCPTNNGSTGSPACPIFRGALAVNPLTGDTFAWTVDENNQDLGIWQDQCAISAGSCTNLNITFSQQLNTAALETNGPDGPATIENGDYNLTLAAVPSQQDTLLMAGANDLWKCSLANSCVWRNTTNVYTCMSAQVGAYQHALAWSAANPLEVFLGNDGGLWRSMDAIGETGPVCSTSDATHFQNLNGSLGSLAEVVSMAASSTTPYTAMIGLGVNGTAGVKAAGPVANWPTVLGGEGGPVAIDAVNDTHWYANNQAGVSIHECSQSSPCTPAAFGAAAQVTDADVDGDGLTMTTPAPFLVDPLARTQLLIGTCRVWRGLASGEGWSTASAVSPILDDSIGNLACNGDALIRSMAALRTTVTSEVVYVGMYGALDGGDPIAGHVFSATIDPSLSASPTWLDLTSNPVTNDSQGLNVSGLDISSIFVDPHDATGNTVYLTVEGNPLTSQRTSVVYGSTDGGAHWANLSSLLPAAPASSIVIDPQDANTAYLATDDGVFSTRQIGTCALASSDCWSPFGIGLPDAPVVTLSALPASALEEVLIAGTYGRGAWQVPLWTAGVTLTTGTVAPTSLAFPSLVVGNPSGAQTVTLTNTGAVALQSAITVSGDFTETDNCQAAALNEGAHCAIQVTFTPSATGSRTGQLTIAANVPGGEFTVPLTGTGLTAGAVNLLPATIHFGQEPVGSTSTPEQITASNIGQSAVAIGSVSITPGEFSISSNACGSQLAAGSQCQLKIVFAPTQAGPASGTVTMIDGTGTQMVQLTGSGAALATDTLTPTSLAFQPTVPGQLSANMTAKLTNSGDLSLTGIAVQVSGAFQLGQNTCGGLLPGHSSCGISVSFAPTKLGAQTGVLTVTDLIRKQTVALAGTGVTPGEFGLSPTSLTFTLLKVGVASPPQTLTITNKGQSAIGHVGFQITGQAAASFAWSADTCGTAQLNPASHCTVQVRFTPAATGGSAATLEISSSSVGVAQAAVALSGTGTTNGIMVSPTKLIFAALSVGQSSPAQTVTITNAAGLALASLNLAVSAQFATTGSTCTATLANGASCSVGIEFVPTAPGAVSGALTVSSPSLATPATVALSGSGATAPAIQFQPQVLTFAEVGAGLAGSPQQITVTNPGTLTAVNGLSFKMAGNFQLATNTCAATLRPAASCTLGIAFSPGAPGSQTGSVSASAANVAGMFASLSGRGFDFTLTPVGVTSQTTSDGQTADYVLSIATLGGSQGSFTFQCGALPPNAQCVFSPPTAGVTASATGSVTVEIETGVTASSAAARLQRAGRWPASTLACGLLLLPMVWRRRRKAMLLVVLIALAAGCLSSCLGAGGGGGSHPPGQGVTPAGTYSIPVTAMSNGLRHSVTLSLTVD